MNTTYMDLLLAIVSSEIGPDWAQKINDALVKIDAHDHSTGKGQKITPTGLNINTGLNMNNNDLLNILKLAFYGTNANISIADGELIFVDGAGNSIQLTNSGTLNVGAIGGILGQYATTNANVSYATGSKTYFFQDEDLSPSKIDAGIINSSEFIGRGILPLGAIIPIASNLAGSMTIPATGVVNESGFQLCDGAVIPALATLSGTIYNLTDDRFLMGSTSSGVVGGNTNITPSGSNTGTQSINHSHGMKHVHQWMAYGAGDSWSVSMDNRDVDALSWDSADFIDPNFSKTYDTVDINGSGTADSTVLSMNVSHLDRYYTGGAITNTGSEGTPDGKNVTDTWTQNVDFSNASFTGNQFDNRPKYVSVQYVMRVK